jgi:hypothetical protein
MSRALNLLPGTCAHAVRICKSLRRPGIDSMELFPPAYVCWRAATNKVILPARRATLSGGIDSLGLQIRALEF